MSKAAWAMLMLAGLTCGPAAAQAPPSGPDIYKCTGDKGDVRFLRITPTVFQFWRDGAWQANACSRSSETCSVDASGRISVRRSIAIQGIPSIDTLVVYDLAAGTETSITSASGQTTATSLATCTPVA